MHVVAPAKIQLARKVLTFTSQRFSSHGFRLEMVCPKADVVFSKDFSKVVFWQHRIAKHLLQHSRFDDYDSDEVIGNYISWAVDTCRREIELSDKQLDHAFWFADLGRHCWTDQWKSGMFQSFLLHVTKQTELRSNTLSKQLLIAKRIW